MMRQTTRLRVNWDGPLPLVGDYLAGRHVGLTWLIQDVAIDRRVPGEVMLSLRRHDGKIPRRATVHAADRGRQTDATGPARARQLAGAGPIAVMRTHWRDPEDILPNAARRPRQITGYRTFCPLRRMAAGSGSQITSEHILAADHFRTLVDLAIIGRGGSSLGELAPQGFGPSSGPSAAAVMQAYADGTVRQVLKRFAPSHCLLLTHVLLLNNSLRSWCLKLSAERGGKIVQEQLEMGRLLTILDILADHYATDVQAMLTEAVDG